MQAGAKRTLPQETYQGRSFGQHQPAQSYPPAAAGMYGQPPAYNPGYNGGYGFQMF